MVFLRLSLLFLLSACTISYYYKGKDLDKNHRKVNNQINKSLKNFDNINQVDPIVEKIKNSEFVGKKAFLKDIKTVKSKCLNHKYRIKAAQGQRNTQYAKLRINKKKKYTNKNKNYKGIKKYINTHEAYSKKIEKFFKQAKTDCGQLSTIFKKYDVKMMNANKLYSKFLASKSKAFNSKLKKYNNHVNKISDLSKEN